MFKNVNDICHQWINLIVFLSVFFFPAFLCFPNDYINSHN